MFVDIAEKQLGWPTRDQILNPKGAGPGVYARLVQNKIGQALKRRPDVVGVDVGVLTANPDSDFTEAPIAIVCEFHNAVSEQTLKEAHSLSWNFSRSPLLITIEPQLLRVWTCCEPPMASNLLGSSPAEIWDLRTNLTQDWVPVEAAKSLHWVQLVTGEFFRYRAERFRRDQRADQMLLSNLRYIRQSLYKLNLSFDRIHDLLARVIFIQFLFQRKDSAGQPALNESVLKRLHDEGVLSSICKNLSDILANYKDAYSFFKWLNERFSGDLFPGKGATTEERDAEWRAEMRQVTPVHLKLLADFVSGDIQMAEGQLILWQQYSFDAIPLEFISSIYEVFVSKQSKGVYYTPSFIVDFMLDSALPWDSTEWDLKILDPACGSGIFLVKAFQRLVHRWRKAHDGAEPPPRILKQLLQKNIFGIDIDPHATRVASFSLYLAFCDEVDPRYYWQLVRFPRLREKQVVHSDFFDEDKPLFDHIPKYDLIVGNAPWGRNSMKAPAKKWAKSNDWTTPYQDIGPLFLPKSASLCSERGFVVMLQPAGSLLYNRVSTAREFRKKLFSQFKIDEVVNLSTLRFGLFAQSISPACIVTMRPEPPNGQPLIYICPKSTNTHEDDYRVVIEPHDSHFIAPQEAATDSYIWSALMWGGRRDVAFIRELMMHPTIRKLREKGVTKTREGIIRGDRGCKQSQILGRPILQEESFPTFPTSDPPFLDAKLLPLNYDPYTHSADSTDFSAFDLPQLIIKQTWQTQIGRFQAALVKSDPHLGGVICSQSYISVHATAGGVLEAACLTYNSKLAVYYLLLTSGRLSSYRPEPLVHEMLDVPLPAPRRGILENVNSLSHVDSRVKETFNFKQSEWALIDDLVRFTLSDFKEGEQSLGRKKTRRLSHAQRLEPDLRRYCEYFLRVLKAGFGEEKPICATIFNDTINDPRQREEFMGLPVRMVAVHLNWRAPEDIEIQHVDDSTALWERLQELNKNYLANQKGAAAYCQRVARIYDSVRHDGLTIPTVYLIKPDQMRYWTRSVALRDADDVASDILLWQNDLEPASDVAERRLA